MQSIKSFVFPVFIFAMFIVASTFNQSCNPDNPEENGCDSCIMVLKPNIYIYPEEKTDLTLSLIFPQGGNVVASIPEYNNGWFFTVDTSGLIDDSYSYLFYESSQPDVWQLAEGWVVKKEDLKDFFVKNMTDYGFSDREIKDFTDYWIPRFTAEVYEIYPQNKQIIESVIKFEVSKKPDNLLRLFYAVRESTQKPELILPEPKIDLTFKREGFFITEWGVVLK
jgi:hypothetical protein